MPVGQRALARCLPIRNRTPVEAAVNDLLQWAAIVALAVALWGIAQLKTNPIISALTLAGRAIETAINLLGGRKP